MHFDAHQHFWNLSNSFTDWPTPGLSRIYSDFGPTDLQEHLKRCAIEGTILVQAAPSVAETEYCLEIARECSFVKGVVGWIDFEAEDALAEIRRLARDPLLNGLRPMVQSISEPGWILDDRFTAIFHAMCEHGLRLDGLVLAHQIGDLDQLAQRHPQLAIILDHGGKPPIARNKFGDWAGAIERIAHNSNVYCKLSGLWTEAGTDISQSNIQPWVDHLLATFGTRRLVWGSDWPVVKLAGSYEDWFAQCREMLAGLSEAERADIFSHNGRRFYGLQ